MLLYRRCVIKIEIGENLIYSYLKHIEGCRIVQTNWKTSGEWKITEYDEKLALNNFNKLNNSKEFKNIFGSSGFKQLIKQAEIDILGINSIENSIFGIDIAFHSNGLNYKGNDGSIEKVLMKIFRTIIIMQTFFSNIDKYNSFFVAPKVNPTLYKNMNDKIELAKAIIDDELIDIKFIANNEFYEKIVDPILSKIKDENDTSELFCRAVKLLSLDQREEKSDQNKKIKIKKRKNIITDKISENGMKIGQFVQYNIKKLFEEGCIPQEEIARLQDKEYSKKTFDQTNEILRSPDKGTKGKDGRNRYYTTERFCGNYYLNSQWVERHWIPVKTWINKIKNLK